MFGVGSLGKARGKTALKEKRKMQDRKRTTLKKRYTNEIDCSEQQAVTL